jgi:metal-responsive CopG/Arc/MetJ family transcriptional regulator
MSPSAKTRSTSRPGAIAPSRRGTGESPVRANRKERVLIEFPSALLKRADEAARGLETNRSGLIRDAVERLLDELESGVFEQALARAYAANADMNRALAKEFSEIDREDF